MSNTIESPKPATRLLTVAAVIVVVGALWLAKDVLIPFALAALLSFLLAPLAARLERFVGRTTGVVLVVLIACGGLGGLGWLVADQLTELAGMIPQYRHNITAKLDGLRGGAIEKASEVVKEIAEDMESLEASRAASREAEQDPSPAPARQPAKAQAPPIPVRVVQTEPTALEMLAGAFGPLLGPLATAGMVLVLILFMLLAREDLRDRIIRLMGRGKVQVTTQAMNEAGVRVSRYLLMQSIINVIHGIVVAAGMYFLGVPNYLVWGLFSGLLRFIPYIGPWIAAAMPILLSLAVFDNWSQPLLVMGYFVTLELISNNVLEPWLYGSSAGVSPLAVIITAIFWTWLWGPIGLFLATPLTVCLVVMGKYIPHLNFINIMLGDEPALEPHIRFYQRILALDQEDAAELAERFLEERGSLVEVYDVVLIPALRLAEMDRHRGDLDERRVEFMHAALRQMIEDLGELAARIASREQEDGKRKIKKVKADEAKVELDRPVAKSGVDTTFLPAAPDPLPTLQADLFVLCLPARDEADEIVGEMLAQVIRLAGARGEAVSVTRLSSEMAALVEQRDAGIVCLSALPPSAAAHARYLCKRLVARFPELELVIGLWHATGDLVRARERIACKATTPLVTTLQEALAQIEQLAPRVRARQSTGSRETEPRTADVPGLP